MSSRKMKKLIFHGFALMLAVAGYSGNALAEGDEHSNSGGGCGSGGSGSAACLWSETFEQVSNPLPSNGWSVTNNYGIISTNVAHNGSRSLKIYDKDPGTPDPIDAVVTFQGSLVKNFSDAKLSFYWRPYNSETPDQLSVQLLSNGNPLNPVLPSITWTREESSGWNKATLDFGAENLNPMGLTLNLAINDKKNFEGFYVDDFCLTGTVIPVTTPVPEPETYAMMLAGLGLLGFMARRRKQNEAA